MIGDERTVPFCNAGDFRGRKTLETERLIIDLLKESDKEDYFHNISHDKKVLETFICTYVESLEEFDFDKYLGRDDIYAIRLKETGRLIGIILYFDEKDGACEIGYGLGSEHWNHGYATEAVKRFVQFLFEEKDIKKVCASFLPEMKHQSMSWKSAG